jgi:hypothetical protein
VIGFCSSVLSSIRSDRNPPYNAALIVKLQETDDIVWILERSTISFRELGLVGGIGGLTLAMRTMGSRAGDSRLVTRVTIRDRMEVKTVTTLVGPRNQTAAFPGFTSCTHLTSSLAELRGL